jgi:hypothetical protein
MLQRHMKSFGVLVVTLALVACETPSSNTKTGGLLPALPTKPTTFSGGNGSSYKTAIVVHASSEVTGVPAEYAYIKAHYPGYRFISQGLSFEHGKSYDIMTFADSHGKKHVLYFDISEYFGRM